MEWTVIFNNKSQYDSTKYCWRNLTMPILNPLRPIYDGTSKMVIRDVDLGKYYDLVHLYRYWKQRVELPLIDAMTVEFSYQLDRSILHKMWPSELLADVVLLVNEQEFKVHRAVLAISSPYFTVLFTKMKESRDMHIEIKEVESRSFEQLLRLIYGYRIIFEALNGVRVLSLIKRFQIEAIPDVDIQKIIKVLSIDNSEFFVYLDIIAEIYGGEHPPWFICHCFDYIKIDYVQIFSDLPLSFQQIFIETYGPLEELDQYKS